MRSEVLTEVNVGMSFVHFFLGHWRVYGVLTAMPPCPAKFGSGCQISRILCSSISDTAYEHCDLPAVGENSCRSRTSSNRPLTGWNRNVEEEAVQISDYRVWTDATKGEEGICKVH